MTFKILTEDTHNIIYSSNIRNAEDPDTPNLRLDVFDREEPLNNFIRDDNNDTRRYDWT